MEYRKVKLREIANITMGQSPKGSSYNNNNVGMPFLQGNRTFGRLYPNIDTWTTEPNKIGKRNSILMSVRAPVGDLNIANNDICIGRGVCSLEMKNGNNQYLFYLLMNSINQIKNKATGTVFDSINRKELEEIEVIDFKNEIQEKITKILFDIDKKIELNNKMNDNLLNFIKIQYSYMINNMKNYESVKLKDIALVSTGKRPNIKNEKYDIPLIGASGLMSYTDKYNYNEDIIIIGRVGTLGVVQRYFDKIWASDNTITIKSNFTNIIENYLKNVDYLSLNRGSTQPLITQTDISNLEINYNKNMFVDFENKINVYRTMVEKNKIENQKLMSLREALLPKLMNGEINLDKVEL